TRISTQPGHGPHELTPGHLLVERVTVRAITNAQKGRFASSLETTNHDTAEIGLSLARCEAHQGTFSCSVGPDEPRDSRSQFERDLIDPDHRTIELRDALEFQDWCRALNSIEGSNSIGGQ